MNWRPRHHDEPIPRHALMGSLAVHGGIGVVAIVFAFSAPRPIAFESYEIIMVEAPTPDQVAPDPVRAEEVVVRTPDPEPPAPEPEPVPETPPPVVEDVVAEEPDPVEEKPEEPEEKTPAPTPPPEPVEEVAATPEPAEEEPEELTGAELNVRMEGLQRDYPAYYGNIVQQLRRCFRPPRNASLATTVYFEIRPDGTTTAERLYERSGNVEMDYGALEAVADCAGRNAAFGPLPDDIPYQRLPVLFTFRTGGDASPSGAN